MRHFVMVDFNKGINIIKHNFLKCFRKFGHSGTVLHAVGGSSSAHARVITRSKVLDTFCLYKRSLNVFSVQPI